MKRRANSALPGFVLVLAAFGNFVFDVQRVGAIQLLDPTSLTKYIDPLPNPLSNVLSPVGTLEGATFYQVEMTQFVQQLHSQIPATTVWGYNGTYPGPTFEVRRGDSDLRRMHRGSSSGPATARSPHADQIRGSPAQSAGQRSISRWNA